MILSLNQPYGPFCPFSLIWFPNKYHTEVKVVVLQLIADPVALSKSSWAVMTIRKATLEMVGEVATELRCTAMHRQSLGLSQKALSVCFHLLW